MNRALGVLVAGAILACGSSGGSGTRTSPPATEPTATPPAPPTTTPPPASTTTDPTAGMSAGVARGAWTFWSVEQGLTPTVQLKAEELIEHATGMACIADSGYSSQRIFDAIRARGMKPVVAPHPTHKVRARLDPTLYALRYRVECSFHALKRFRAVATRYEKSGRNFLAAVHVACIMLWLN